MGDCVLALVFMNLIFSCLLIYGLQLNKEQLQ